MRLSQGQKISIVTVIFLTAIHLTTLKNITDFESNTVNFGFFVGNENYAIYEQTERAAAKIGVEPTFAGGIMREDYREWLAAHFVDGNEPDVFLIFADDLPIYVKANALLELPKNFSSSADNNANANSKSSSSFDDKIFALPFYSSPDANSANDVFIAVSSRSKNRKQALLFLSAILETKQAK